MGNGATVEANAALGGLSVEHAVGVDAAQAVVELDVGHFDVKILVGSGQVEAKGKVGSVEAGAGDGGGSTANGQSGAGVLAGDGHIVDHNGSGVAKVGVRHADTLAVVDTLDIGEVRDARMSRDGHRTIVILKATV